MAFSTWYRTAIAAWNSAPHVAHLNTSGSLGLARDIVTVALLKRRGVPTVVHLRFGRTPELLAHRRWEGRLLTVVLRQSAAVISLDAETWESVKALLPEKPVLQIPNFGLKHQIPASVERKRQVLFTGRLEAAKGLPELIEAWESINTEGWQLRLAGPVDSMTQDRLSKIPNVTVLGTLDHQGVTAELAAATVYVLPSRTEGFPNGLLEAMFAGCACVASDVGAIPDMLAGGAGLVVPKQNVERLSEALESLLSSPAACARLGQAASTRASEKFSSAAVVPQYLSLWRAVAQKAAELEPEMRPNREEV